jgi:hypothetical protein
MSRSRRILIIAGGSLVALVACGILYVSSLAFAARREVAAFREHTSEARFLGKSRAEGTDDRGDCGIGGVGLGEIVGGSAFPAWVASEF